MSVYDMPQSYQQAKEMLGGKSSKIIANKTRLVDLGTDDENIHSIGLQHHASIIVTFYSDETMVIDSHGYNTVTTKQRINSVLGPRFRLYQKDWAWYLWDRTIELEHRWFEPMPLPTINHPNYNYPPPDSLAV